MMILLLQLLVLLSRYLHIVCTTLLVGGTLFYEMVVPVAIDDLRPEQQLSVFARARWVFKGIVWFSATVLLLSGIVNSRTHWQQYTNERYNSIPVPADVHAPQGLTHVAPGGQAGLWWAAHAASGIVAVIIALSLTIGAAPPVKPIRWMRLNLVILLLVIFLATVTRQARLQAEDRMLNDMPHSKSPLDQQHD